MFCKPPWCHSEKWALAFSSIIWTNIGELKQWRSRRGRAWAYSGIKTPYKVTGGVFQSQQVLRLVVIGWSWWFGFLCCRFLDGGEKVDQSCRWLGLSIIHVRLGCLMLPYSLHFARHCSHISSRHSPSSAFQLTHTKIRHPIIPAHIPRSTTACYCMKDLRNKW